jgi:hypothetical protein
VSRDGTVGTDLPWTLRELLLAAVKSLPEQTQQLLCTAAVGGSADTPRRFWRRAQGLRVHI